VRPFGQKAIEKRRVPAEDDRQVRVAEQAQWPARRVERPAGIV
jgi:hypothetical protein